MDRTHLCQVLGSTLEASFEELKRAFRRRLKRWHPDRVQRLSDSECAALVDEWRAVFKDEVLSANEATARLIRAWEEVQGPQTAPIVIEEDEMEFDDLVVRIDEPPQTKGGQATPEGPAVILAALAIMIGSFLYAIGMAPF